MGIILGTTALNLVRKIPWALLGALAFAGAVGTLLGYAMWMGLVAFAPVLTEVSRVIDTVPHFFKLLVAVFLLSFAFKNLFGEG